MTRFATTAAGTALSLAGRAAGVQRWHRDVAADDADAGAAIALLALIALAVLVFLASSIKIASEDERVMIFRLGRYIGSRGPGLVFLLPLVDRGVQVKEGEEEAVLQGTKQA